MSKSIKESEVRNTLIKSDINKSYQVIQLIIGIICIIIIFIIIFIAKKNIIIDSIFTLLISILGVFISSLIVLYFERNIKFSYDKKISVAITESIIGNKSVFRCLKREKQEEFIRLAFHSMYEDVDFVEMIDSNINYFLSNNFKIKTMFDYTITLKNFDYKDNEIKNIFESKKYIIIQESLHYTIKYPNTLKKNFPDIFELKFLFDNDMLEKDIKQRYLNCDIEKEICIFRESLKFLKEDMDYIISIKDNKDKLIDFFEKLFNLNVEIYYDEKEFFLGRIYDINLDKEKKSIIVSVKIDHNILKKVNKYNVKLSFQMPVSHNSSFTINFIDPTSNANIQINNACSNKIKFSVVPFINESVFKAKFTDNVCYYINTYDKKWIYPNSGLYMHIN